MTPLAGLIIGILAGLFVRPPRRAMAAAIPPWLAVLGVQTWHLSTGHGVNAAGTIREPGYWIVQLISLSLTVGLAAGMCAWYSRRVDPRGGPTKFERAVVLSAIATGVSIAVSLPIVVSTSTGNGKGSGAPPIFGILGILACLVSLAILGIVELRARRRGAPEPGARLARGDA